MPGTTTVEHPPPLPPRPDAAHKGNFGTVTVIGGCTTMIGAPAFCASAALRIGAGRARLAVPADIMTAALTLEPGATGLTLPEDTGAARRALDESDPAARSVLAVGPGWGRSGAHADRLASWLAGPRPIVLDADGLNALAAHAAPAPRSARPLILTPHPGEFRRLAAAAHLDDDPTDPARRPGAALALARVHGAIVVLKGHRTVVTDGEHLYTNGSGNAALATAGSGDVLTGTIAGLLAQSMAPFDAAALGVYLHGAAADAWAAVHGPRGLTAATLVEHLVPAMTAYTRTA